MNYTDVEPDLYSSDKPHFIMMYYYSYTLLDKICYYFGEDLLIIIVRMRIIIVNMGGWV